MVNTRGSVRPKVTQSSRVKLPSPYIPNKEAIWEVIGRERSPQKENLKRGPKIKG